MAKTPARRPAAPPQEEQDEGQSGAGALAEVTGALPASLEDELQGLQGYGYSERAEDSLVPILAILQDNSAEVKRQHPRHIEGALPGDLIIRSLKRVIHVDADAPLVLQPAGFQHMWVCWSGEPGEGQVVAQYPFDERPTEAVARKLNPDDDRETWVMPDGTRLVDTRYHYCQVFLDGRWTPLAVPFAGTNHTVSRTWTNIMKGMQLPSGAKAPAWFRAYGFTTKFNSRGSQSWYTYDFRDLGWIGERSVREAGRELYESVESQIISADVRSEGDGAAAQAEDDRIPI